MSNKRLREYFFGAVLTVSIILTLLVFRSYMVPLVLGGVLAVISMPMFRYIHLKTGSRNIAAGFTVLAAFLLIVMPAIYFFAALAGEVGGLINNVSEILKYDRVSEYLYRFLPQPLHEQVPTILDQSVSVIGALIRGLSTSLLTFFANLAGGFLSFAVMMFSTFYLLRDGHKVKRELLRLSPLSDVNDEAVFTNVVKTIRAVVVGFMLIGFLKGILSGLGYWVAGVPAPLFWGAMTGLAFFIPVLGTGLVMVPVVVWLALQGSWGAAIGLGIFSVLIVGTVDNFLQPLFIGGQAKIHPLLILLALLGGLQTFGFAGLIIGPLILAVSLALIQIYKVEFGDKGPADQPAAAETADAEPAEPAAP
jgi:predicted PurR-regulated permease PerM